MAGFYSPEGFPVRTGFGLLRVNGVFYCPLITMVYAKYDGIHPPTCLSFVEGHYVFGNLVNFIDVGAYCVSQEAHL